MGIKKSLKQIFAKDHRFEKIELRSRHDLGILTQYPSPAQVCQAAFQKSQLRQTPWYVYPGAPSGRLALKN